MEYGQNVLTSLKTLVNKILTMSRLTNEHLASEIKLVKNDVQHRK